MQYKISKKRISIALLPLLAFNLMLIVNLVFFGNSVWSQEHDKYEWDKNERLYTSKETQEVKSDDGKLLYKYEGEDGDCWKEDKEWQQQECREDHPYGGQGTMTIGDNLVVDNAQAIYLNGYDSSGYNWMMTTTTEPYGNTIGTRQSDRANVMYGNNIVLDGTMETGSVSFAAGGTSVTFDERTCEMVDDGVFKEVKKMTFNKPEDNINTQVLQISEQGVCGMCEDTCSDGKAGKDYQLLVKHGLDVKENTKVNEQIRLCGYLVGCEEACCRLVEYFDDDIEEDFVGADCSSAGYCATEDPPAYCEGVDWSCTYCYPQEYPHNAPWVKPNVADEYSGTKWGYYVH